MTIAWPNSHCVLFVWVASNGKRRTRDSAVKLSNSSNIKTIYLLGISLEFNNKTIKFREFKNKIKLLVMFNMITTRIQCKHD